jgi:glycosyltransferase involved in cell wall biosynthesis
MGLKDRQIFVSLLASDLFQLIIDGLARAKSHMTKSTDLTDLADLLDSQRLINLIIGRHLSRREWVKQAWYRLRGGTWLEYVIRKQECRRTPLQQFWPRLFGQSISASDSPRLPSGGKALEPGIGHYGLFRAEIGIGQGARRLAGAIRAAGIPLTLHNISLPQFESKVNFEAEEQLVSPHETVLLHFNADTFLDLFDRFPLAALMRRRRIGHWVWELPVFPPQWVPALKIMHEIWVPSRYVAETVANANKKVVRIVPYPVPVQDHSQLEARKHLNLPVDAFTFLTIFDSNSFLSRKNPLGAIRTFTDAFPRHGASAPILIIKCHGRANRGADFQEIKKLSSHDSRLLFIDRVLSEHELTLLQAACDCLVSLHRAEGFGFNIAECMGKGKIVIATNFSGSTDFTRPDNSLLVPYKMVEVGKQAYVHGAGQWWAEPDHDAAVAALQRAYANASDIERLANRARADIMQQYSFDAVGRIVKAAWQNELEPFRA